MKIKKDFFLPAMILCSSNSYAFDWLFEPDMHFSERYEDNLRMAPNPTRDNMISTLSPGLKLGYVAENDDLSANLKWNELIYHGESSLDFSEKIANIGHHYSGERFKTDISADYALQSSLNTQLDETGSGFLQTQVPRTNRSFSPNFSYSLTERNSLQLGYGYTDVSFEKPSSLGNNANFSDYTSEHYFATITHSYTERLTLNLSGSYVDFESSSETPGLTLIFNPFPFVQSVPTVTTHTQKSTTLNYQAGMQYAFSERMQISLSAGMRTTETETIQETKTSDTQRTIGTPSSQSSTTSGHVFSASFSRNSEWGGFSLSAGQQLNPASTGTQQQSTSFSASARYNLSERWNTGINASYLISSAVGSGNSNNSRTYATLSPNIQWRWTPEINLGLSYSYRQQEFGANSPVAIGNSVQLQFSYQPQINRQVK